MVNEHIEKQENFLAIAARLLICATLFLFFVGGLFYFFIEYIFSGSLNSDEISKFKLMYLIILFSTSVSISTTLFNSIINAHEKFVFLRLLSITSLILRPILVISIFTLEADALVIVLVQALIVFIEAIAKGYYIKKRLHVKIKFHYYDVALIKEMLGYSTFIFLTVLMDQIFWKSDQIIIGILLGTSSVAIYSIASQIVMYYMTLSLAMSGVFLPKITKKVASNASKEELSEIFIRVGRLQYIVLGCVVSGFIVFGEEFINIWVGENFKEAYYIAVVIMLPFTIDLIQNIGLTILQAKNKYSFRAIVFLFMAILNVIASIFLIQYLGIFGSAIATSVSYFVGNGIVMNIYYSKAIGLKIKHFWIEILKLSYPVILSIVTAFICKLVFPINENFASLSIYIFGYICVYIFLVGLLGLNRYEKKIFSDLVKGIMPILKK